MGTAEKELGKKSSIAFVAQIVGQILNMLFVVMAGRLFGKSVYGDVVFVITILNFVVVLTKFGFENSLVAFIARTDIREGQKRWIVKFSIRISFLLCFAAMAVFFGLRGHIEAITGRSQVDETLFLSIVPLLFFQTMVALMSAVMRGYKDIRRHYTGSLVLGNFVRTIGIPVFYFIFGLHDAYCLVVIYYVSYVLNLLYCIHYLQQKGLWIGEKEYFSSRELLGYSFPLLMAGMVQILNREIDQYMLGYFLDSGHVAIYSVASNVATFSHFTLAAVNSIFAPMISELYHMGRLDKLQSLYSTTTKWIVVVNVMIFGMILVFADDIMRLAGDEFAVGGTVLIIVMLGQLINSGVGSVAFLNSMTGHPKCELFANCLAVSANIVLNFLLIRDYGMIGVGVASAVSIAVCNIVNFIFVYRNLHMHPYSKRFVGIVLGLACSVPVIFILRNMLHIHFFIRLIICGVVYVAVYGVVIYLFVADPIEKRAFFEFVHGKLKMRQ